MMQQNDCGHDTTKRRLWYMLQQNDCGMMEQNDDYGMCYNKTTAMVCATTKRRLWCVLQQNDCSMMQQDDGGMIPQDSDTGQGSALLGGPPPRPVPLPHSSAASDLTAASQ